MRTRTLCAAMAMSLAAACWVETSPGQLIYQEGFNDDGDGTRYTIFGRGAEDTPEGPAMWEHNFLVDQIGTVSNAPAKRAAILWNHNTSFRSDFATEAYELWDNLANWAMDGEENATIGFFPSFGLVNIDFDSVFALAERFEDQGHTVIEIPTAEDLPDPADLDLLIHTSESSPTPPTLFIDYPVPGIFFNAGNHDDTAVAQIGTTVSFSDPLSLDVVAENADHPVLDGLPSPVPWTTIATLQPLHGMGNAPPGGEVLLTYEDPDGGGTRNGLIVIDEGGGLLGSFGPEPEGEGFFVGASLDDFGDMATRVLELNPVDISGHEDVRLTVDLAATDADFEPGDFLRVMVGESGAIPEEFVTLADYVGVDEQGNPCNKGLSADGGATCLLSGEFTEASWTLSDLMNDLGEPVEISNLVVRFEALNTFPNEIVAIDDVRIHSGPLMPPAGVAGDYNNNGQVEQADLDLVLLNWGQSFDALPDEWVNERPGMGIVDQAELDGVLLNWGNTAAALSARAVPEPGTLGLLLALFAMVIAWRRFV